MKYETPLFQSALRDDRGLGDIAYISLAAVMAAVFSAILMMVSVSAAVHLNCHPQAFVVKDVLTVIECKFDPQPLGIAVAAVCGGFATALAALAGYMLATRPPRPAAPATPPQQPSPVNISMSPTAASAPAAPSPLKVDVVGLPGDHPQ